MYSFVLGVASLALLLGFLVGASSSPVAGVAVTAGFAMVAAALAYMQSSTVGDPSSQGGGKPTKAAEARALSVATLNSVGRVLMLFSVAFAAGIALGIWARTSHGAAHESVNFPWKAASAPTSARQAIDWILVYRHLRQLGYTDPQIAEIYRLNLEAKKTERGFALADDLLSTLFSQVKLETPTQRLIANQPTIPGPSIFNDPFGPRHSLPIGQSEERG